MRRILAIATLMMLTACQPPSAQLAGSGMDMFAPVKARLHPLSRIITPTLTTTQTSELKTQNAILEARIELTDQFADTTKTPGTLKLELFDQPPVTHKGDLLQTWTFTLDKPESNREYWDRTTRTYLFKLALTDNLSKRDHVLAVVTVTLPNGTQLTDDMELPLK